MPPDKLFLEGDLGVHLGSVSPVHSERKRVWSGDSPQVGRGAKTRSQGDRGCSGWGGGGGCPA